MSPAALPIPTTALPQAVLRAALDALERGCRVVLASVITRRGSTPSTPGQKLVLLDDRTALGTIGGGAIERVVLTTMREVLADPERGPKMDTFRLGPSLGMCCGGSVDILIEPLVPEAHALIVGAGHVGIFLAPLLASLGFVVTVCDSREEAADPARLPAGRPIRLLHADPDDPEVLQGFPLARDRCVALVMTHDHQLDQAAIEWALAHGFGFVGGVGSRAKAARTRQRLEAKSRPEAEIARVRMPVGADIGARSPAEISVAIAAELIAWRARAVAIKLDSQTISALSSSNATAAPPASDLHETES
jgi:xanthine dehydrogenase accessory factor